MDWLSDKSSGTSEFWEASRAKNLEPSVLVSRFFFNTGATSGIGCEEGETPFMVCEQQLAPNVLALLFES